MQKLLNIDNNAKTPLGNPLGYMTGIMYLAPANLSGFEVCARGSTVGCRAACLNTAGRGGMNVTQAARVKKTLSFFADKTAFMRQLAKEIDALARKAERKGATPCVRLNGTSDVPWERVCFKLTEYGQMLNIFEHLRHIQFYDYTKRCDRRGAPNYHLTYSLAESNHSAGAALLGMGHNVAIVYRDVIPLQDSIRGTRAAVIDGTKTDLRFLDAPGSIVGLCAKGKARYDTTGFVRD